ncbi:MAG TPA: hypothetical protein VF647_12985 [Longimicrobium sp.]|jgi:hypothetical protein
MRKLRGLLTSGFWALHRHRTYFVKWSWFAIGALVVLSVYLCSEVRLGFRNQSLTEISAAELASFAPSEGTEVRIDADFKLADYWVGKERDAEVYYTLLDAGTGSVLVKSSLPAQRRTARVHGTFERLDPQVGAAIARSFPSVPQVVLNLGKRPLPLWLSVPGLLLAILVLIHAVGVLAGSYGFKERPLPANARAVAGEGMKAVLARPYLRVTWANLSLGDLEAMAIFGDDALRIATAVTRTWEVANAEFEGSSRTIDIKIPFRDLRELKFGSIPVGLKELPALVIQGRRKVVVFSEALDPLITTMFLVQALRAAAMRGGSPSHSSRPVASAQ